MGLFSKKKQENKQISLPPKPELPEFPDLPSDDSQLEFPSYEPTIADIKNEVERDDSLDIPQREAAVKPKFSNLHLREESDEHSKSFDDEKPIFVKIEKYKEAMKHMDLLNKKITEAEDVLGKIDEVREKEHQKVEEWKRDLAYVKEKLLAIDKELFGD